MRKYILLYTGLLLSVSGCSLLELDESTGLDREDPHFLCVPAMTRK